MKRGRCSLFHVAEFALIAPQGEYCAGGYGQSRAQYRDGQHVAGVGAVTAFTGIGGAVAAGRGGLAAVVAVSAAGPIKIDQRIGGEAVGGEGERAVFILDGLEQVDFAVVQAGDMENAPVGFQLFGDGDGEAGRGVELIEGAELDAVGSEQHL